MKDEIKEILDYLKIENGHCSSELSYDETHLLLDYITNLQEGLKIRDTNWQSLKYYLNKLYDRDYIEEEIFDDICKRVNELENQIEIKSYQKEITNLQEENEKLLKKSYSDDAKITKAIEYIKSPKICIDIRKTDGTLDFVSTDELLKILGGEE